MFLAKWIALGVAVFMPTMALAQSPPTPNFIQGQPLTANQLNKAFQGKLDSPLSSSIILPDGTTATTQAPFDNTSKAATDAFVQTAIGLTAVAITTFSTPTALAAATIPESAGNGSPPNLLPNRASLYVADCLYGHYAGL